MDSGPDLPQVCAQFQFEGALLDVAPYGSGHIHCTFTARYLLPEKNQRRYLLQRINRRVFPEPEKVIENLQLVTGYLRKKSAAASGDPLRSTLTLIPARDGHPCYRSTGGEIRRAFVFIEGAGTCPFAGDPQGLYQAARARRQRPGRDRIRPASRRGGEPPG